MSLQLSWKACLAIACCVAIMTGCAPFRPWSGNKAAPAGGKPAARTASNQDLDGLLEENSQPQPRPASTKSAMKSARTMFGGDNSKKEAARQAEIDGDLALARLGERRGQSDNAKQLYLKITQKFPEHPAAFHRLGVLYAQEGNYNESHRSFENALQIGTPSVDLLSDVGYCYYLESRYEEAERVLRQAQRQKPNHESTCNNLGLVLGAQGRFAESLEMFQRVNSEAEAYSNLAYVFSLQGDLVNAKKGYVQALTLDNKLRQAAKAVIQVEERLQQHEHQQNIAAKNQPSAPAVDSHTPEQEPVAEEPVAPPTKVVRSATPSAAPARTVEAPRRSTAQRNPLYAHRPAPQEVVEQPMAETHEEETELAPIVDAAPAPEAVVEAAPIEEEAPLEVQPMEPAPTAIVQDDPAPVPQRPLASMPKASNVFRPSQRERSAPREPVAEPIEAEQPVAEERIVVRPSIVPPMTPATKSPSDVVRKEETPKIVTREPAKQMEPAKLQQPQLVPAQPKPTMEVVKSAPITTPAVAEKKPNRASSFVPVENFTPTAEPKLVTQQPTTRPQALPVEPELKPAPINKPLPVARETVTMSPAPRSVASTTEPTLKSPRTLTMVETSQPAAPKLTTIVEKSVPAPAAQTPPLVAKANPAPSTRTSNSLASLGNSVSTKSEPQVPAVQSNPYFAPRPEKSQATTPLASKVEPATLPPIVNAAPRASTRLVPSQVEVAESTTNTNLPPIVNANDYANRKSLKTAALPVATKNSVASAPTTGSGLKGWVNTRTSADTTETLAPVVTPEQLKASKAQR